MLSVINILIISKHVAIVHQKTILPFVPTKQNKEFHQNLFFLYVILIANII